MAGKTSGAERDARRILAEAGVAAIDDLRGQVAALETRLAEVERERDEARAACSEARTAAGSLTAELEQERTLSAHLQERATAAEARVRELEGERDRLHALLHAGRHTLEALEAQIARNAEDWKALRTERDALRAAVEEAMGPLAIGASYADQTGITLGLRTHARDCAKALRTLTAALSPAPPRGSISTWCPECGPHVATDEDGCCTSCGATATGGGADAAVAALERAKKETEPCAE